MEISARIERNAEFQLGWSEGSGKFLLHPEVRSELPSEGILEDTRRNKEPM